MLRALVLALLLANAAFLLWSQGHLAAWGLAPDDQREPARIQQQIAPGTVRLLNIPRDSDRPAVSTAPAAAADTSATPEAAPVLPAPADARSDTATDTAAHATPPVLAPPPDNTPKATAPDSPLVENGTRSCWQAKGFTAVQAEALRAALSPLGLPAGSWQLQENRSPGRWLIYLGRYDNLAQLERKRAELRGLDFDASTVTTPGLTPGLSLGAYPTEAAASQALQEAQRKGIRTARVALEQAESLSFDLRLPAALPAQRSAVAALGPALAGKKLQACR